MVWQKQKSHKAAEYKILDLNEAGHGGLNIQEVEYAVPLKQSPKMLNMMIKNGVFGKRYGQELVKTYEDDVVAMAKYKGKLYMHTGNSIEVFDPTANTYTTLYSNANLTSTGRFIVFNKYLYYLSSTIFIQTDGSSTSTVEPYCPDVCINRTPAGDYSDLIEDYNRLGAGFKNTFSGDGTATEYHLIIPKENDDDTTGLDATTVLCTVDNVAYTEGTEFTVNRDTGVVTFTTAPSVGTNNVVITAYKTFSNYESSIMNCKYWAAYGGQNNSRLFLGGNGTSTLYYSDVFNASYFPESNYAVIGNTEDDITGFGSQYDILVVFKPTEIYGLEYKLTQDTTGEISALFYSSQINVSIGCDMPKTIQYVDNRLTWASTDWGVCTLCSTVIEDERNIRVISRNINGGERENGLLQEENLENAVAIDYEGKYILCINNESTNNNLYEWHDSEGNKELYPDRGYDAYMWDYTNSPYTSSDKYTSDFAASMLAWYLWKNIKVDCYQVLDRDLYYARDNQLCKFSYALNDFGTSQIEAFYQTPLMDFGAYHMLKTIKKVFIETRGDTPTLIRIKYITDEAPAGEADPESITINEKLWTSFGWSTFGWSLVNFAKTFARKCSIKKVNLFAIGLCNNEINRDMAISGIKCEYTLVKEIK